MAGSSVLLLMAGVFLLCALAVGMVVIAVRARRIHTRIHPVAPNHDTLAILETQQAEARRIERRLSDELGQWSDAERLVSQNLMDAEARVAAGYGRRAGDVRPRLTRHPEGQG